MGGFSRKLAEETSRTGRYVEVYWGWARGGKTRLDGKDAMSSVIFYCVNDFIVIYDYYHEDGN